MLLRLGPFSFDPTFIMKARENRIERARLKASSLAQFVSVAPGVFASSKGAEDAQGLGSETHQ